VAGVLVAGMLLFLAREVSRGSSADGGGDTDKAAAGANGSHRRTPGPVAARGLPTPRADRGGEAAGDRVETGGQAQGPAVDAPPPKVTFPRVPMPAVGPAAGNSASLPEGPTTSNTDPEQDEKMAAATDSYDNGDYQGAQEKALAVLETSPRNIKALRIVVSTACMFGEMDRARELNARLPKAQQEVVAIARKLEEEGLIVTGAAAGEAYVV
jgi:hypothetical protein